MWYPASTDTTELLQYTDSGNMAEKEVEKFKSQRVKIKSEERPCFLDKIKKPTPMKSKLTA